MTSGQIHATQLLGAYYSARNEATPEIRAKSLLRRVTIRKADQCWRSQDLVDAATDIVRSAAFDVDDLAENFLHVDLLIDDLRDFDAKARSQVFGLAVPDARSVVICERAERYLPLYRATVAHELGHILMHHRRGLHRPKLYAPKSPTRPAFEREADEFMVQLLLPVPVLQLSIGLVAQANGLALQDCLGAANSVRGRWQWRHLLFRPLIESLCLSRYLLSLRLNELGIFSKETVGYHTSYSLVHKWSVPTESHPFALAVNTAFSDLDS